MKRNAINTSNPQDIYVYVSRKNIPFPFNGRTFLQELWEIPLDSLKEIYAKLKTSLPVADDAFAEFDAKFGKRNKMPTKEFDIRCQMQICLWMYSVRKEEAVKKVETKKRRDEVSRRAEMLRSIAAEKETEELRQGFSAEVLLRQAAELEAEFEEDE